MKRVIFVRHGQSEWNAMNQFTGWVDVDLTNSGLQGLNKQDTADEYGAKQVQLWRRSYDTLPPLLKPDDPHSAVNDRRYAHLQKRIVPMGENLKTTLERKAVING